MLLSDARAYQSKEFELSNLRLESIEGDFAIINYSKSKYDQDVEFGVMFSESHEFDGSDNPYIEIDVNEVYISVTTEQDFLFKIDKSDDVIQPFLNKVKELIFEKVNKDFQSTLQEQADESKIDAFVNRQRYI